MELPAQWYIDVCMNSPSIKLKTILVPVDFSEASQEGLHYAAAMGKHFGARLDLLYVVEPPSYPAWGYAHLTIRDVKLRKAAKKSSAIP